MKTNKLILTTVCAFLLTIPAHAQFNTIGTFNSKHIKKNNPPKSNETLTDSISLPESITETGSSENIDVEEGGSPVALPLRKIHISSGFGMRKHPIYNKRMMHNGIDLSARYENVNDYVNAGMSIAISGNTGASTGPHLHITAKKDGHAFNAAILIEYIMRLRM